MELIELHALNGPNYWSTQHPQLIVLKLRCESGTLNDELLKRLKLKFPGIQSLSQHAPEAVMQVALHLQSLSDMRCEFGYCTKANNENEFYITYEYCVEKAGLYAAQCSIDIISQLLEEKDPFLDTYVKTLHQHRKDGLIGPTTNYILDEVRSRRIPIRFMNAGSLIALGHGRRQKKIRTAVTDGTSAIGLELAGHKEETKAVLMQANVPVPKGIIVNSKEELAQRLNEVRFPVVVKPLDGNHGRGVTTNIYDLDRALFGYDIASRISEDVIIEEFVEGEDHRFLVIDYKLVAVARRSPASVTGDGKSTIAELIAEENKDPRRGTNDSCVLAKIVVDEVTKKILSEHQLQLDSILKPGEKLVLKDTANISAGGTATDLTNVVHPYNKFLVERIARIFMLDICGVDIMTRSVEVPITRETGAVIEVNAGPGIRMHSDPQKGTERNVAKPIIDMLFPDGGRGVIPIIVLLGSKNVAETIQLISKAAQASGIRAGYNGPEGIFIHGQQIKKGNCSDQENALNVLFDPMIDLAIIPCEEKDLKYSGLSFDACSTCAIMDCISEGDEFNKEQSLERLAAVVSSVVAEKGYLILDTEDPLTEMLVCEKCKVALFSEHKNAKRIKMHLEQGGIACYIENETLFLARNSVTREIGNFKSLSSDQKKMIMVALLAMTVNDFKKEAIVEALQQFN
jgi:cyanophycin synthetase